MDIRSVVTELKQQVARINQAIAALEGLNVKGRRRGRLSKVSQSRQASESRRRTLSAAARAKIAAAQGARWAKQRTAATQTKAAPVKTSGRRQLSPTARKRLSAIMKARWAKRRTAKGRRAA